MPRLIGSLINRSFNCCILFWSYLCLISYPLNWIACISILRILSWPTILKRILNLLITTILRKNIPIRLRHLLYRKRTKWILTFILLLNFRNNILILTWISIVFDPLILGWNSLYYIWARYLLQIGMHNLRKYRIRKGKHIFLWIYTRLHGTTSLILRLSHNRRICPISIPIH